MIWETLNGLKRVVLTMNLFDPVRCSSTLQEYKMTAAASQAPAEGSAQHCNTHNTP